MTGALAIIALGPGLYSSNVVASNWHFIFFEKVCHQDPLRSYSLNGLSMAVCARCLGIYITVFAGMVLMPLNARWISSSRRVNIYILSAAIGLNALDVLSNALSLYSNTLNSRFILGAFFGFAVVMLINDEFFKRIKLSEDTYGREYTS